MNKIIIKNLPEFVSNVVALIEHQTVTELLRCNFEESKKMLYKCKYSACSYRYQQKGNVRILRGMKFETIRAGSVGIR